LKGEVRIEEEMQGWCTLRCTKLAIHLPCMTSVGTTPVEGVAVRRARQGPKVHLIVGHNPPCFACADTTPPSNSFALFCGEGVGWDCSTPYTGAHCKSFKTSWAFGFGFANSPAKMLCGKEASGKWAPPLRFFAGFPAKNLT